MRNLLIKFVEQYKDADQLLATYLCENDHASAKALSHSIKGSGANLGALALSASASEIESCLKNDSVPDETQLDVFYQAVEQLSILHTMLNKPENQGMAKTTQSAEYDVKALQALLVSLLTLVQNDVAEAQEKLQSIVEHFASSPYQQELLRIQDFLWQFDIEEVDLNIKQLIEHIQSRSVAST